MFEPAISVDQPALPPQRRPEPASAPAADYFGTPQPPRKPVNDTEDPFAQSLQPRAASGEPPVRHTNKKATVVSSPDIGQGTDRQLRGALFVFNNDNGRIFPIYEGRNSIGRSEDREIVLQDTQVSGEHSYLFLTPEGASYIDISTNGSRVNNKVVHGRQVEVANGSVIQVGALRLILTIIPKEAFAV